MKKIILPAIAFLALLMIGLGSCVKQKFDSPPDGSAYDPMLPVNNTILALKNMYTGSPTLIDSDYVVSGIVTADDRSGCFYKQIVVQDSTSGIVVLLGRSSGLYTDYPIGRKIYIRCKGLYLGAYGQFIQLGYTPDITNSLSTIPSALIPKFIVKANTGNPLVPINVTISQIASVNSAPSKWLGTLIRIDSAEFVQAEVNTPYAQDPNISSGTDRHIEDCVGKSIVVRMSGYANFRNVLIPTGKGPITAIYSRYNSTAQLLIRDTFDVNMRDPRCGGVIITPAVGITIDSLRRMYNGNMMLGSYKIHGVVISSFKDSNISKGGIYMQDESGRGINVYYGGTIAYKIGDSLSVDVSSDSLIVYKGILEVKKSAAKTTTLGTGKLVVPTVVTLAQLTADMNNTVYKERVYESTLVKIVGCTISGTPNTYGDAGNAGRTITDAALDTYILYCRNALPYSTTTIAPGIVNITGISSKYNSTNQLLIRALSDVQ